MTRNSGWSRHPMLETTIVVVLAFVAFLFINGWVLPQPKPGQSAGIEYSRRPFRFSLWTLFVLTTLVAVLIGIVVIASGK
jgi:hypothetical protein